MRNNESIAASAAVRRALEDRIDNVEDGLRLIPDIVSISHREFGRTHATAAILDT
eukprot:CAMPEP_0167805656 /NCGR_PEP_ID=MMETSP0111_2-20121227/21324_1 /TAXON_ID=91324 /ORGANISM="Lotharella globosa, Strain CCCM811" /LENGTH=54 /DNA_ID=CAMNT_0007702883 /DNA_START=661 /DNA_END=825 /DNA_ORIENTATION=+